ncbi:MAG TPA: phage baseplate assembly protein V [Bryobacteraceae bacterium]|jgi:uncharacterized protein involved in type VI secretion and phage assembly
MNLHPGVVIGLVINTADPLGEGRILLEFPWLPGSPQSAWAPIAAPMAGASRGLFFSPEVGDEVLVAFEQGDFEHPFVLGFLWNGSDVPPESDRNRRVIVTVSGHRITLDDNSGGEKIEIKSSSGQTVVIDDAQQSIELHGGGRILALKAGQVQIT